MTTIHTPIITTGPFTSPPWWSKVPPLLTEWYPESYCTRQWFYDSELATNFVFSGPRFDTDWRQCQPYGDPQGVYSPGICPGGQELKEVLKSSRVDATDGSTSVIFIGRCCGTYVTYNGGFQQEL